VIIYPHDRLGEKMIGAGFTRALPDKVDATFRIRSATKQETRAISPISVIGKCSRFAGIVALAVATFGLAACSGGGGGGGGTVAASGGSSSSSGGSGWVSGVFAASSTFAAKCQTPRTGVDSEGNAFPDTQGNLLDEKNWLRSWTHETYLWNTEVVDTDPSLSTGTAIDYFNTLKTNAVTASGKPKDQFHFTETTADYLAEQDSDAVGSFGADIVVIAASTPRNVVVAYTDPNTPASAVVGGQANLIRGDEILTINGIDVVNGATTQAQVDTLNADLFTPTAGTAYTFVVLDPGAVTTRTVTLTAQNLVPQAVNRTSIVTDGGGNKVAYVLFNTFEPFSSETQIMGAIQTAQTNNVKDLVLDLRYNGGGLLAVASELSYMIAGNGPTTGHNFEKLTFNNGSSPTNPVTGQANTPTPFYNTAQGFSVAQGTPLPALNLPRVFVLTTDSTCSASEVVINGLRGVGVDVVEIGGQTCGKPYGFYPQDNCGTTYFSIQFEGVNDAGFGGYADGFVPANSTATSGVKIPGCAVADDYSHNLGDPNEALLAAALGYGTAGTCPVASVTAHAAAAKSAAPSSPALIPPTKFLSVNQDLRMPKR